MGNTDLEKVDPTSKKIYNDVALATKLIQKANEIQEHYEKILGECTNLARKNLKNSDKQLQALEYINKGCNHIKEADFIMKKLIAFYHGSREKVPGHIGDLATQVVDSLNDLYQKRETLVYCIECIDNQLERQELREKSWVLDHIKITTFSGSPESILVEAMGEVIDAKRSNALTESLENRLIECALAVNKLNKKNAFNPFEFLNDVRGGKYIN